MSKAFYIIFMVFVTHYHLKFVYEFFLFTNQFGTNKFKKRIYPKKYSLWKRFFMLTYFDKELKDQCAYKEQMKKVLIVDLVCAIWGFILFIVQIILSALNKEILAFNIILGLFFGVTLIIFLWVTGKGIRWDEYVKGKWQCGQLEFKMNLPDEKKKKRKK